MRDLERKIEKLEQQKGYNQEEVETVLDSSDLDIFERIQILYDAGIISGEEIAKWIKEGVKNG